jgi:hypothetical protein
MSTLRSQTGSGLTVDSGAISTFARFASTFYVKGLIEDISISEFIHFYVIAFVKHVFH